MTIGDGAARREARAERRIAGCHWLCQWFRPNTSRASGTPDLRQICGLGDDFAARPDRLLTLPRRVVNVERAGLQAK